MISVGSLEKVIYRFPPMNIVTVNCLTIGYSENISHKKKGKSLLRKTLVTEMLNANS